MRTAVLALVVALAVVPAAGAAKPNPAHSGVVQAWVDVALDEIKGHSTNPPRAARVLAHVSSAMYPAAVLGGDGAVAGAAATVLSHLYPDRAAAFAALVSGDAGDVALGQAIGARLVARAQSDGSSAAWTGTVPAGPGLWVPLAPGAGPLEPLAGTWRTWNIASGSALRPGPPPAPGTARYAAEVQAVYDVSQSLTPAQKAIALFWADGAGTETPPGHWNRIALDLLAGRNASTVQAARIFATLNTAQADAFIACWDAKFAYWSERPVTAIRRELAPGWTSFIGTPPFPSYVSGHSTTSGAAATVLSHFFPQARAQLAAMADEAKDSRLYGGIHFPVDNDTGLALGRSIGREALRGSAAASLVPPA